MPLKIKSVLGNNNISLKKGDEVVFEVAINGIDALIFDTDEKNVFIQGNNQGIYLATKKVKAQDFISAAT